MKDKVLLEDHVDRLVSQTKGYLRSLPVVSNSRISKEFRAEFSSSPQRHVQLKEYQFGLEAKCGLDRIGLSFYPTIVCTA
jgi:hypothetical protein